MRPGGRIVNLSSVASHLGKFGPTISDAFRSATAIEDVDALMDEFEQASQEGTAKSAGWPDPYSVSKAGINAATRVLAKENPGIAINCCCPGESTRRDVIDEQVGAVLIWDPSSVDLQKLLVSTED